MAIGGGSQQDSMMSEINVTPLVDVMLVLLVVFIITAPMLAPQALKVNLPKTAAVAHDDKLQKVSLGIDAKGALTLDANTVTDEKLQVLLQARAVDPQFQLQIQADTAVNYGRVAQVMALAQKAGVSKLSFLSIAGQ